jgi:hypothetical protein
MEAATYDQVPVALKQGGDGALHCGWLVLAITVHNQGHITGGI